MWPRDRPTAFGPGPIRPRTLVATIDVLALDAEVAQRLPELDLGLAFRIDVGGVDEIDAGLERAADERGRARLIERADRAPEAGAAAEGHRAEADFRDELAGPAERSIAHAILS